MTLLNILETVDWSRAQFALTAMYHWLFVPLTLGLGFICAFMETIYFKKGFDPQWKRYTKFWMKLFAINFAIGVATGIILEFEFGTNWSNYSYFVGDIFGAPLAIEGIFAFFMESTFIAVMYFGWNKVSPRFHLTATWLTAAGASISAIWILIANAWMQLPVGMQFNIETARNEMVDFWAVALSPMALNKIVHTVTCGFVLASIFVIAISAWFLLKKREETFAKSSMKIAAIFGLISSLILMSSGHKSGILIAKYQPVKFAAIESIYDGEKRAPLTIISVLNPKKTIENDEPIHFCEIKADGVLSILAFSDINAFVPGLNDLVYGNEEMGIISTQEKIDRGRVAINKVKLYNNALKAKDTVTMREIVRLFNPETAEGRDFITNNFKYFGYGYLSSPTDVIPNIPMVYYSFRIMVALGLYFVLLFAVVLFLLYKNKIASYRWILYVLLFSLPLPYLAGEAGWVVTEVGRQPWTIQDLLPTIASISSIEASAVKVTFFLFGVLFTTLLIAEIGIMIKQVKIGPKAIEEDNKY
ncbi:MAG: cytochrome ubiquinol oxidase subunit I [Rikenellaceae bacterium]